MVLERFVIYFGRVFEMGLEQDEFLGASLFPLCSGRIICKFLGTIMDFSLINVSRSLEIKYRYRLLCFQIHSVNFLVFESLVE